jgi:hypothetical protein
VTLQDPTQRVGYHLARK